MTIGWKTKRKKNVKFKAKHSTLSSPLLRFFLFCFIDVLLVTPFFSPLLILRLSHSRLAKLFTKYSSSSASSSSFDHAHALSLSFLFTSSSHSFALMLSLSLIFICCVCVFSSFSLLLVQPANKLLTLFKNLNKGNAPFRFVPQSVFGLKTTTTTTKLTK